MNMKRLFFVLCTFAVMFAAGCSKEEIETPLPEYKLVVNMDKPSFGDNTRAPRRCWENGDEVVVVFHSCAEFVNPNVPQYSEIITGRKYLKLTYDATDDSWAQEWVGTTPAEIAADNVKICAAAYGSSGFVDASVESNGLLLKSNYSVSEGNIKGECVMACEDGTYTVEDNVISLNITMTPLVSQFTVRNISVNHGKKWGMAICRMENKQHSPITSCVMPRIQSSLKDGCMMIFSETAIGWCNGYDNEDGVAFFCHPWSYQNTELIFIISDGESVYSRTFKFSDSINIGAGDAIIMDGPTAVNLNGWVELDECPIYSPSIGFWKKPY